MIRARLSALGFGTALRRVAGIRLGRLIQYSPRALSVPSVADRGSDEGLPSIAIVTPSFNQAAYVGATLESVLSQDYPHLEYVVQDAGSTDGTLDVLAGFNSRGAVVIVESDRGQSDALNRGFGRTSSEIMAYLNADDMYLPGTLHRIGRFFRDHPSVDVVYGNRLGSTVKRGRWAAGSCRDTMRLCSRRSTTYRRKRSSGVANFGIDADRRSMKGRPLPWTGICCFVFLPRELGSIICRGCSACFAFTRCKRPRRALLPRGLMRCGGCD